MTRCFREECRIKGLTLVIFFGIFSGSTRIPFGRTILRFNRVFDGRLMYWFYKMFIADVKALPGFHIG